MFSRLLVFFFDFTALPFHCCSSASEQNSVQGFYLTFMQYDPPAEQRIHSSDSVIIGSGEINRFLFIENYKDLCLPEDGA